MRKPLHKRVHFKAGLSTLLFILFGLSLEVFHFNLVPHHLSENGSEWTHNDRVPEEESQKESRVSEVFTEGAAHENEGPCAVYVHQQSWRTGSPSFSFVTLPAAPALATLSAPKRFALPFVSISAIRLAPKNSPPSHTA